MTYEEIKDLTLQLSYRDKLRLAQLLIQLGRKDYVSERLLKSRPSKVKSLENFIDAMFQFKGAISEEDRSSIISNLQQKKIIKIEKNVVLYLI